jgi:hypothetical protein
MGRVGTGVLAWRPEDVVLVVKVAEEPAVRDVDVKSQLDGAAGYGVYWVITDATIYKHTAPGTGGLPVTP